MSFSCVFEGLLNLSRISRDIAFIVYYDLVMKNDKICQELDLAVSNFEK